MASNYSKELADILQKYIDDEKSIDKTKLRQLLQETSVVGRYKLLTEVNSIFLLSIYNGIWSAAWVNDISTLKCMMDGFTSEQAATLDITYALQTGAGCGSTEVVEYLLALLNQDQRVEVLMKGDSFGDTALHKAISNKHPDTAHVILASVTPSNQMKLLQIKNKRGQSVEDLPAYSFLTPTQGGLTYLQRDLEKKLNKLGEANAKQQKASAKEIAQLRTELAKQNEDNVEQQRVSAEVIAQLQTDIARQERAFTQRFNQQEEANAKQQKTSAKEVAQLQTELAKQKKDNVEQKRVSAEVIAQLQTEIARQERVFTQRFNQHEEDFARQERAFLQRFNQQEEEMQRLVKNFTRFEVYLKTPEVCDARGDQEIEDDH